MTIAKIAYRDNKSVFRDVEATRDVVRYVRGAHGQISRQFKPTARFRKPIGKPGDPFATLPDGKTAFFNWEAYEVKGPMRALVLSDIHITWHDKTALIAALQYGREKKATVIVLNGDTLDFFSVSKWENDPRQRDFAGELETGRAVLAQIRKGFPRARIIFKEGNHEERWSRYLRVKAPELLGVAEFELAKLLRFDEYRIERVGEKRPIRLGQLNVLHGHEYSFPIANPVNPARGLFTRALAHSICGHLHQNSQHSEKTVEQKTIGTWSTGCLCDLHPEYRPQNKWSHGFAYVEVFKDGKFEVANKFISNGKVY